ncbi:MAG: glycoside hydrolase family 43 protein [Oscillospiraceae bacterium]|jgi:alpha-N-arabinofuranosidase|nr:glycoside hydrolase family 43 protein [Oscillospiraceae bacterium]
MCTYENPVIKGYNPDPSVCRAGEDYYLVTSSFEYFPGVPVYHSKNLVNWTMVGHCLTRKEQLFLDSTRPSGGIYAPTIRFYNGRFCMATTNVSHKGNFIVTAPDPRGPWSNPVWIKQGGIDPDIFFDDDGTVYFTSTGSDDGKTGIYLCSLHPETLEQHTQSVLLTMGGGGRFVEAPHLYKKDGTYYLMLAEGGTEFGHMVTIFRSRSITGPYEPCPHNPILSHRGADAQYSPIQCTGHADLLEDHNGNWWMVALATRPLPGVMLHNLGRETFLAPVTWDKDGWPVVNGGGTIALSLSGPLPAAPNKKDDNFSDDYATEKPDYLYIRNPAPSRYTRCLQGKTLTLRGSGSALREAVGEPPTFLGIRQAEFTMTAQAEVTAATDGAKGGLSAYYGPDYHYAIYLTRFGGVTYVRTVRRVHDLEVKSERVPIYGDTATLCILTGKDCYKLCYIDAAGNTVELARGATAGLCTEGTATMTFTGTLLGMFAERGEVVFGEFTVKAV